MGQNALGQSNNTEFLNQPYLWNKMMKQPDFLHVDTDSCKLEVD